MFSFRVWQRPFSWQLLLFFTLCLLFITLSPAQTASAGSFITQTYNGRTYKLYIPDAYDGSTAVPLVVMLHGCSQDPDQFAAGTEMNTYADAYNVIILYPEQPSSAHNLKCWHWFDPAHQARGLGEPALIAGMVNQTSGNYYIDDDQVYVAGLSAGAATAVIMGAAYPDMFAAVGVGSGLEYKAATSELNAWSAMLNGGPDPMIQGNAAYNAMGSYARVVPTIVFHGADDWTVRPINGDQVISQAAQTNDRADDGSDNNSIDDTAEQTIPGSVPGGHTYTQSIYKDASNNIVMEKYIVTGMGHAWSGGSTAGSYTDPNGPEASQIILDFFLAHPMGGTADTTPPVTTTSPSGGSYPNAVTVALNVNEAATIYYTTDDSTPTTSSPQYSSSFTFTADTTLKFFSVDAAGNVEAVQTEIYTITDPSTTEMTFTSVAAQDGYVGKYWADGYSPTTHKMGDKGMYNQDTYRAILSFDTSALPDNATITAVTLRITQQSQSRVIHSITVDVKNGTFGSSSLQQSDYSAAASGSWGNLPVPNGNNQAADLSVAASGFQFINVSGITQVRLKVATPLNFAADELTIYGGENSTYAPLLIVTYEE